MDGEAVAGKPVRHLRSRAERPAGSVGTLPCKDEERIEVLDKDGSAAV